MSGGDCVSGDKVKVTEQCNCVRIAKYDTDDFSVTINFKILFTVIDQNTHTRTQSLNISWPDFNSIYCKRFTQKYRMYIKNYCIVSVNNFVIFVFENCQCGGIIEISAC